MEMGKGLLLLSALPFPNANNNPEAAIAGFLWTVRQRVGGRVVGQTASGVIFNNYGWGCHSEISDGGTALTVGS